MLDPIQKKSSGYYIFGVDVFTIPCFRDSFLYGTSASLGTALLTFLATSNSMKSFNYAFGALMLTSFPYMMYCQNKYYSTLDKLQEVQDRVKTVTNEDYRVCDSLTATDLTPDKII